MKTFAIGDIHGADKALLQCLERAAFNYDQDRLIVLGDVCDGYRGVRQCIDELLKIKHCDYIIGNHDVWALAWGERGEVSEVWTTQGGLATIASYGGGPMPAAHIDFLKKARPYLIDKHKLFVHGGFEPGKNIETQPLDYFIWDRRLVQTAWNMARIDPAYKIPGYDEIIVGHTTTQWFTPTDTRPLFLGNVIMLDTGAGWSGKLSIMDVDSHQYWQSDLTPTLQGMPGRG